MNITLELIVFGVIALLGIASLIHDNIEFIKEL